MNLALSVRDANGRGRDVVHLWKALRMVRDDEGYKEGTNGRQYYAADEMSRMAAKK